jgi:isopentenyl-diphosphate delta-isomerase
LDLTEESDRKKDHIDLATASATLASTKDDRFYYEPMLSGHPSADTDTAVEFLNKNFVAPIWVSSMTGGTGIAKIINENLARACKDFGLGMGLGSCRKLLRSDDDFGDFDVRQYIGNQPLYANLGIAQLSALIQKKDLDPVHRMMDKLSVDGLIIHVNPTQEWLQPEGDILSGPTPIQVIAETIEILNSKIIVKEVGQGIGPKSLLALMKLPLAAIEFAAYGGTNFAKLENLRDPRTQIIDPICYVGHDPDEMIDMVHYILDEHMGDVRCKQFIISGGVKDYLDGYFYNQRLRCNSIYGQAAGFLKHAHGSYDDLAYHIDQQVKGYQFAQSYLSIKQA